MRMKLAGPMLMRARGFSLIEVMVTAAIAAVLAALAYPSFVGQLQKTRRADAWVALVKIEAAQARYRGNNSRYGNLDEIGVAAVSPAGHYTLAASSHTASGYTVTATATGSQSSDATCRHLKFSVAGANPVYRSGPDDSADNPADQNRECWRL